MHLAAADCGALRNEAHPLLQAVASSHVQAAIDNAIFTCRGWAAWAKYGAHQLCIFSRFLSNCAPPGNRQLGQHRKIVEVVSWCTSFARVVLHAYEFNHV
jgi:hypothetical protein